jgi:hypothetical protein
MSEHESLPPLVVVCPVCKGDGRVETPEFRNWRCGLDFMAHEDDPPDIPSMTVYRKCHECGGIGRVPTRAGKQVLELLHTVGFKSALPLTYGGL